MKSWMIAMKKTFKIVEYYLDYIESSASYYDVPGPIIFFYKPKKSINDGIWVKVRSKKIAKKQSPHFGGDFGVMKISRYPVQFTMPIVKCTQRERYRFCYGKVETYVKDLAFTLIKKLNKSGYLIVSFGDMVVTSTKKEFIIQFNFGMVLNEMTIEKFPDNVQQAFVWKTAA